MKYFFLLLAFIFIGCSPQDLEIQDLDIIIIDPSNPDFYKYSDASDSGMGWVETKNGDKYSFNFKCGKVVITSKREMKSAYFMKMSSKIQTRIKDNSFSREISKKAVFRIYY